jgi:hypothetical protein
MATPPPNAMTNGTLATIWNVMRRYSTNQLLNAKNMYFLTKHNRKTMKKLSKKEQQVIKGGTVSCYQSCRPLLAYCTGPTRAECPEYMECLNACFD